MRLFDVVLLSLSVGFFIIGIHQSYIYGLGSAYWIFMVVLSLILWVKVRNNKTVESSKNKIKPAAKGKSKSFKKTVK